MSNVIRLPLRTTKERAATCGCGGQTFLLVAGADDQPDIVVCGSCASRVATLAWQWVTPPEAA